MDFLILSYLFFAYNMEVPHICAGEDFLKIAVVHHLLRYSGAFFMRRSFKDDLLYKSIFREYLTYIL
jgi:glycerol-3-phosphate O-acyltransferase